MKESSLYAKSVDISNSDIFQERSKQYIKIYDTFLLVVVEMKKKPEIGAQIAKLLLEWHLHSCLR